MSTSDPDHPPTDGAASPPTEGTRASQPGGTDRPQPDPPAPQEPAAPRPATPAPARAEPGPDTGTNTGTGTHTDTGPGADTARHAVVRPAPTPPPPSPAAPPTREPATPATPATEHAAAPPAGPASDPATAADTTAAAGTARGPQTPEGATGTPQAATATPPAAPRVDRGDDDLFPAPNAPRSTSVGAHVLGAVVGLLLAPAGVGLVLVGQARILAAQVDGWDASTEVLGIVLLTIGLVVLGFVALLSVWSAAAPIAGGALLTVAGGFYLFAPSIARSQTLAVLDDTGWRLTVTQVTVAGTSGTLLVAGFLVLLAGVAVALARRRGVRLGEFRERHRA